MDHRWLLLLSLFLVSPAFTQGVSQDKLDYMARYLEVTYQIVDKLHASFSSSCSSSGYRCQIALSNTGTRNIPGAGWTLFFGQRGMAEPFFGPYPPDGTMFPGHEVRFRNLQGGLFSMEPDHGFLDILAGHTRVIQLTCWTSPVVRGIVFPYWYLARPGLTPRTMVNTANEDLNRVSRLGAFDQSEEEEEEEEWEEEEAWGRSAAEARYAANTAEDLGGPGKHVLPTPTEMRMTDTGFVQLNTKDWVVLSDNRFPSEEKMLAERLRLRLSSHRPHSHVIIFRVHDLWWNVAEGQIGGPEAYTLIVNPDVQVIEIKAHSSPGAFYGVMTLLNLMDDQLRVPGVKVIDAPRYTYRGLMLDVARNFRPVDHVLQLLELMALYKMNKFHLHLTDDEGWRLQIPGLEELTEVGGQRCHDLEETECLLPFLGSGPVVSCPGSGFYTVEDYKTILRYAADRHIQVIPEVEMPGHAHAAIKAMEARRLRQEAEKNDSEAKRFVLADNSDQSLYQSSQLFSDDVMSPCLDSTYEFVTHVVRSLVEMHRDVAPLQLIHVGGKEVAEGAWVNSSVCEVLLSSDEGQKYKDPKEYFIKKVSSILHEEGLNLAAWEAGLVDSNGVPYPTAQLPNHQLVAFAWNNVWGEDAAHGAYRLANAGYRVVMSQASHLFFDQPYEPEPQEGGRHWATHTKETFSFMPSDLYANDDVTRSGDRIDPERECGENRSGCVELTEPENIIGIQGHLWSEAIRTKEQADHMLFPRFLALAERAWHKPLWESEMTDNVTRLRELQSDWSAFANTLGYRELARLERQGLQYRVPPPGAIVSAGKLLTNVPFPGLQVEYSSDDGHTWCQVPKDLSVTSDSSILLRTRSATGGRYSRTVNVQLYNSSAARPYTAASLLVSVFLASTALGGLGLL